MVIAFFMKTVQFPGFMDYIAMTKNKMAHEKIPGYENYFTNLDSFNPLLNHLDSSVFLLDFRIGKFLYVSPNTSDIFGSGPDEIMNMSLNEVLEMYHPKDAEIILNRFFPEGEEIIHKLVEDNLFNVKISYNYRYRKTDGTYIMLLQQFSYVMLDEDRNPLMIMGTISNIHDIHNRRELFCRIHHRDKKNNWNRIFELIVPMEEHESDFDLSPKEMEIIKYVNRGLSSKEIANLTQRSIETINTQRKKILNKTNCRSMHEVIAMANKNGWV